MSQLYYRLKSLGTGTSVLHIGAHPDDEEIGMLSYLTHSFGIKVAYWSATRGEGGQNKIGPHTGDALGLYRTWESEWVREGDGGTCLYGPFVDFGYSKDANEGFEKWGRERLVKEIVRAIRMTQPQLVINRWTGTHVDGHGHHESVGQVCEEAFDAAGDPTRFPELQDEGLSAWTPLKLYLSEMRIGHLTPSAAALFGAHREDLERPGVVRIDSGIYDPVAGESHQERAWKAYNRHQSQAMGWLPKPGRFYYYFSLTKSLVSEVSAEQSFFDGFDPSLCAIIPRACPEEYATRLAGYLKAALAPIQSALEAFRIDRPQAAVAPLLEAHDALREARESLEAMTGLSDDVRGALARGLDIKRRDLEDVAAACLQLEFEAVGARPRVTPGGSLNVLTRLWNHSGEAIEGVRFRLQLPPGWNSQADDRVDPGSSDNIAGVQRFAVEVAAQAELTSPYWLEQPRQEPYVFAWPEGEPAGRPLGPAPVLALCEFEVAGRAMCVSRVVQCREAFPGGFRELDVQVVAPIAASPDAPMKLFPHSDHDQLQTLVLRLENYRYGPASGELVLTVPEGWSANPARTSVVFDSHGQSETLSFAVRVPGGTKAGNYPVKASLIVDGRSYNVFADPVRMGVPGVPSVTAGNCAREAFILSPSTVTFSVLDIAFVPDLRYAYIEGAAQKITETLESFGLSLQKLTDREVDASDLSVYDAIIVGHNAYLMRDAVRRNAQRLLDYTKAGGTLIVEFQGYGYQGQGFTPYPFSFTVPRDRVVYEDAPVRVLAPEHFLFQVPNVITDADFEDWVVERGLYFFGEWDARYTPLLSCADPGEEQKEGGYLIAHYGHGTYVYNAYAFFRQIPAGNSGALRLFANLLALPEARVRERMDILRAVDIFKPLTENELRAAARLVSELWVEEGELVCRKGEPGDALFIIDSGELEVVGDGGEVLYRAQPGDCVGELAVLCDIPRTATMRASCQTQLLQLNQKPVHDLLDRYPMMSRRFIDVLVRRLYLGGGSR